MADTQRMPAVVVQHDPNHIPQWAVKALLGLFVILVIPGGIGIVGYVFGRIHARLSESEKNITELQKQQSATEARLEKNEEADKAQWKLIREVGNNH